MITLAVDELADVLRHYLYLDAETGIAPWAKLNDMQRWHWRERAKVAIAKLEERRRALAEDSKPTARRRR